LDVPRHFQLTGPRAEANQTTIRRQRFATYAEAIVPDLNPDDRFEDKPTRASNDQPFVIPVIEESLHTSKRLVTTGVVRIDKSVREREVILTEPLNAETVDVERVPMNVILSTAPSIRTEGDVTVIPVIEEVLVTTKQLRLVEEVRITRRRATRVYEQTATLRSEEVTVERQVPEHSDKAGEDRLD
jgi:uncharacterized protein (TIGR02271 family)